MELTEAQYTVLQELFPGCSVDVLSSEDKTVILLTRETSELFKFSFPEDAEPVPAWVEESERVEAEAINMSLRHMVDWIEMSSEQRQDYRMRARRYLGL